MKKRLFIISLICLAIAGIFWTQSRYPALNEKAMMAGRLETNRLSFDTKFEIAPDDSFLTRIFLGTGNWAYTNKQGMTFGVVFGGAFLTLLQLLPQSKRKNGFLNSIKGLFTGTPLGVCANCVAPIGKSMYESGSRIETVLATMISSPTMNIVVLTMLFSLFSFSFAVIKVVATLILILVIVPLLTKLFFQQENESERVKQGSELHQHENKTGEAWLMAVVQTFKSLARNLWYLIYKTVPLMLIAGFLGIVLLEFFPLQSFLFLEDSVGTVVVLSLLATFIPAPITFDIIVASSLKTAGLSTTLTMIFLIAAGTYSIYPAFILYKAISKRVAITMFLTVMLVSIAAGLAAGAYDDYRIAKSLDIFDTYFQPEALN